MKKIDRSHESRKARYQEYLGLLKAPFLSQEQNDRLCWLMKQRKEDNRTAMREFNAGAKLALY